MSLGFTGKSVYVYGLGKSGISSIKALIADGATVYAWDDNASAVNELFQIDDVTSRRPNDMDWKKLSAVIKAPGIPMQSEIVQKAVTHNVPVMGDIDLFWRKTNYSGAKYIGITGTNGKSTITALVGHILKSAQKEVAVGGNIGNTVLDLPQLSDDGFYVIEMSSYQLETAQEIHFNAAGLVNLSPDHLDRHGSMDMYLATKMNIFSHQFGDDVCAIGIDEPELLSVSKSRDNFVTISVSGHKSSINVAEHGSFIDDGEKLGDLSHLSNLPGRHNWQNIAMAWALLRSYLSYEEFIKGVDSFQSLPHRLQQVGQLGNLLFVNDSKATNPESAIHALESFENIYWLAGGRPKAEGIKPCLTHLQNVKAGFVFGEAENAFAQDLLPFVDRHNCGTLKRAIYAAVNMAQTKNPEGAVVLLSPACASFDQFPSFEKRGEEFVEIVSKIIEDGNI